MNQDQVISAVKTYLENEESDYAIMISGAWGSGKTYLLKNQIFDIISKYNRRPIYISLIGVKSEDVLRQNIYEKINPFYRSSKKTEIAHEAETMEQIINKKVSDISTIPKNIVFCFDDLERIAPEFLETAMGYLNTFIEHNNNKCIFLCNETVLKKEISHFKIIKEKYIRFTYHLKTDINSILEQLVEQNKFENLKGFDCSIISDMYRKGSCTNIRTLLFSLSVLDSIFKEFNLGNISVNKIDIKYTKEVIARFVCFIAIELKNGTKKKLLDEISDAIVTKNLLDLIGEDFENDLDDNDSVPANIPEEKKRKIRDELVERYFSDNTNVYFQFLSISDYISNGIFDPDKFREEINLIDIEYNTEKKRKKRDELLKIVTEPFDYKNDEILDKIKAIANEVEEGKFSLKECIQIYRNILWLYSYNLRGLIITKKMTKQFKKGVKMYIELERPDYVPYLTSTIGIDAGEKINKQYKEFLIFIDRENDKLINSSQNISISNLIEDMKNDKYEIVLKKLVSGIGKDLIIKQDDAQKILDAIINGTPKMNQKVYEGFSGRYADIQMIMFEKNFIIKLKELMAENPKLAKEKPKELSQIPVIYLLDYFEKLINERHLIVENNEE